MAQTPSVKRIMIDKANGQIVGVTAVAAFVVIFCLVASYILIGQLAYQNRVIGKKKEALTQLKTDIQTTKSLVSSYKSFVSTSQNIIGGNPDGQGLQDGDNAKIVLDALPSKYDFPALATSLETLLQSQNVQIQSIGGTDDEVAQSGSGGTTAPAAVAMPFQLTVSGTYDAIKNVVEAFNRSIRPIELQTMQITGSESEMTLSVTGQSYYQPEKVLNIKTEVVN